MNNNRTFLTCILVINLAGCSSIGSNFEPSFNATDIDLVARAVDGVQIDDLLGKRVKLKGHLRETSGTPVLELLPMDEHYEITYFRNCINLVIDGGAENFSSGTRSSQYEFYGEFIYLPYFGAEISYISHEGIEVTPACKNIDSIDEQIYFRVYDFHEVKADDSASALK